MKKQLFITAILLSLLLIGSCDFIWECTDGNGIIEEEERFDADEFDGGSGAHFAMDDFTYSIGPGYLKPGTPITLTAEDEGECAAGGRGTAAAAWVVPGDPRAASWSAGSSLGRQFVSHSDRGQRLDAVRRAGGL